MGLFSRKEKKPTATKISAYQPNDYSEEEKQIHYVYENGEESMDPDATPKFFYYFVRRGNKWGIEKAGGEAICDFNYEQIFVESEGDLYNVVIMITPEGKTDRLLIEEGCDFRKVIKQSCAYITLIEPTYFGDDLYKFALSEIGEQYRKLMMDNMSLDEDAACNYVAQAVYAKTKLQDICEEKHKQYLEEKALCNSEKPTSDEERQ